LSHVLSNPKIFQPSFTQIYRLISTECDGKQFADICISIRSNHQHTRGGLMNWVDTYELYYIIRTRMNKFE
jgi:hypothetical protein